MTHAAHAVAQPSRAVAYDGSRTLELLLIVTVFVVTLGKLRVNLGGDTHVFLYDVTSVLFVAGFLVHRIARRDWVASRTVAITAAFFLALLAIYLVGFFNLATAADRDLFFRGIAKTLVHFSLVVCSIAYLERRSLRLYWQVLAAFVAGLAVNAVYALCQLALVETTGRLLDQEVLGPLGLYERGGINVFGSVGDSPVYRATGLTLDPNHLGVMLVVPILVVFAIYLRLERGHGLRVPFGALLVVLGITQLSTLSRSGMLGVAVGLVVLAVPYRHLLVRPRVLVPVGGLLAVLAVVVAQRADFFAQVVSARTQVGGSSARMHFEFYTLVRPVLDEYPLFGLGLNTFPTYYEFLTGRADYGPHSHYVALLTETGLVGTVVYTALLVFVFGRLGVLRRLGRRLGTGHERLAARVRPLGWGLTAALIGTLVANLFYLTAGMYYFYVLLALVLAAPLVVRREMERADGGTVLG